MRCDGHVKITEQALIDVFRFCPPSFKSCESAMFNGAHSWLKANRGFEPDAILAAVTSDNARSHIADLFGIRIYNKDYNLAARVAAVDIDKSTMWTHNDPNGQRYHFMRSKFESEFAAYQNGINFIRKCGDDWVASVQSERQKGAGPLAMQNEVNSILRSQALQKCALALHALQDAFSPGHVVRSMFPGDFSKASETRLMGDWIGNNGTAPPIRRLFIYDTQDHGAHKTQDHAGGTLTLSPAQMAVDASADFILMGIGSIENKKWKLDGWNGFVSRWLSQGNLGIRIPGNQRPVRESDQTTWA